MTETKPSIVASTPSLFTLISVIYGAVFSYAMFIFSLMLIALSKEWKPLSIDKLIHSFALKKMVLFCVFMIYMTEDIGTLFKTAGFYPFKTTARYTYEIFIALLYISSFSLLDATIYYCLVPFTLVIFLGGLWHQRFKKEYAAEDEFLRSFIIWERNLHYFGSAVLILMIGYWMFIGKAKLRWETIGIYSVALFVWMLASSILACKIHDPEIVKSKVIILLPAKYIKKLSNRKPINN